MRNKREEDGAVDPRILRAVIEDGSFVSDPLAQTYFAGVLASSRTPTVDDDRALLYLSTLKTLSNRAIKLHFDFYTSVREYFAGCPFYVESQAELELFSLFVPTNFIDEKKRAPTTSLLV